MTDLQQTALPPVLQDALDLAAGAPVDTSALARGPLLFDLGDHPRVMVSGRDRVRFLHAMLSNDVANLAVGSGRWATFNTVQGRTVSDVRLFNLDDDRKGGRVLALLEPGARGAFVDGLDRFVISEKVFFEDDEGGALWLLAGQGADELLRAAGAEPPPATLFAHAEATIGGRAVRLLRLDRSRPDVGDVGLWMRSEDVEAVLAALGDVPRGERRTLEAARIAAGQVRFGVDMTSANIPLEAGLKDRAISFTKGCYIGQEVICRIDSLGKPARALVRIDVEGAAPAPGDELLRDGKAVGWVTSVSPRVGGAAAFGYVKKKNHDPGTVLQVGGASAVVGEAL
jgi:folate-binding protein YgfZ